MLKANGYSAAQDLGACAVAGCSTSRADLDTTYCLRHGCIVIHCDQRRRRWLRTCEHHRDVEPT